MQAHSFHALVKLLCPCCSEPKAKARVELNEIICEIKVKLFCFLSNNITYNHGH